MNNKLAKILVVDDEPTNVKLLERVLELGKFERISSEQDSTKVVSAHEKNNYDLIILDINMPIMSGFDVIEALNKRDDLTMPSILVLTAQHQLDFKHKALQMGANDFLTKPFDQVEVLARVNNLTNVQLAHNMLSDQNAVLDELVRVRTQELARANDDIYKSRLLIVRKLGRAAEYRDNETGLHIIRMSQIAALLASRLGLSATESEEILNAAPMHDIGKIGIPDEILLKPGKLDPDEWEIMKTHTVIGADILDDDDCELLKMAKEIAISHHEKFDGSGYPYGLKGDEIPLSGRITSLADVFDALTSERPYKKAWDLAETITYIKDHSGSQFDPKIVQVLIENLKDIVEIKYKYAESKDKNILEQYVQFKANLL